MNPIIWFLSMVFLGLVAMDASAPWFGLAGEQLVDVGEPDLELWKRYGAIQSI
jgi:hypothetical protein